MAKKFAEIYYNNEAPSYIQKWEDLDKNPYKNASLFFRNRMLDAVFELGNFSENDKILDAGSGTGITINRLLKRVRYIIGIDISRQMILEGKENIISPIHVEPLFIQGDCENLPFKDNLFDKVISVEVVRYIPDFERYLYNVWRVLKPGGRIIYTATNVFSLSLFPLKRIIASKFKLIDSTEIPQYFTRVGPMKSVLKKQGFSNIVIKRIGFWNNHMLPKAAIQNSSVFFRKFERIENRLCRIPPFNNFCDTFAVSADKL